MLKNLFSKPIELTVGEQVLQFSSISDFEFSLTGRTSVPSKKIISLVKLSLDELRKEAKTIKDTEKKFVYILSKSIEKPETINRALREMDAKIFSQDHSWRLIIAALHNGDDELNAFRRIALVKYMQYLSSRQEIIKHLYSEKKKHNQLSSPLNDVETGIDLKDTLILDSTMFEPLSGNKQSAEMEKMPKGENVTIRMKPNLEIDVVLSRHQCKIVSSGSSSKFVDQAGRSYELKTGKNLIGRDSKSDIVLDPNFRDISRMHLLIEADESNTLYLTDLSAHGTYIPIKYLESHTF
ncbi:MAG TPA: FHA domain-containing protein [Thiotrichaceae bacterium]|jgi:hypothetical protein|nr:FHA domain-containing protein [Thiotrichaceae bacterium]HIM08632.1 FHA domain-containing protein [Gammaproteobacteria bacterium]